MEAGKEPPMEASVASAQPTYPSRVQLPSGRVRHTIPGVGQYQTLSPSESLPCQIDCQPTFHHVCQCNHQAACFKEESHHVWLPEHASLVGNEAP